MRLRLASLFLGLTMLSACSPALDWRQINVPEAGLTALFPCKPQRVVQEHLGLMQCEADGQRFVLGWQRWHEPQSLRDELAAAPQQAASRADAELQSLPDAALPPDALAWPGSGRFVLRANGQQVQLQFWARGLMSFRAMVVQPDGARTDPAPFFDSLRSLS